MGATLIASTRLVLPRSGPIKPAWVRSRRFPPRGTTTTRGAPHMTKTRHGYGRRRKLLASRVRTFHNAIELAPCAIHQRGLRFIIYEKVIDNV
jgi:hypothetical protein